MEKRNLPAPSEGMLRRLCREANDHYKAHQGGTLVTIVCSIAAYFVTWLKLDVPPWTVTIWFIMFLSVVIAFSAWFAATKNALTLEHDLRPKIQTACGEHVTGSRGPNKTCDSLRIVVLSLSTAPITDCRAFIIDIHRNGEPRFTGNTPQLTFYPAESAQPLVMTVYPEKAVYIDVVYVHQNGSLAPGTYMGSVSWNYAKTFQEIIDEIGEYEFTVKITGQMPTETVRLKFNWTGNWKTARLDKV
jgi:hypothetical protein